MFFAGVGESAELVLFLTCDTQAKNVKSAVYNDMQNIRKEAIRISGYTGLSIREISFRGSELDVKAVVSSLRELSVECDDVLIFYFSGHGFRTPSKKNNPWPNLYFTHSDCGIDYQQVITILSEKHPRLLIAIADCCNNMLEENDAPPVLNKGINTPQKEKVAKAYWKLFMEMEGEILVTSSKISEYSWCVPKGALFTLALLESIRQVAEKNFPDWKCILNCTAQKVKKYQHPFYIISPPEGGLN